MSEFYKKYLKYKTKNDNILNGIMVGGHKVKIVPLFFNNLHKEGDFAWMVQQRQYSNYFFIFNDNVRDHYTSTAGGGNGIMREYNIYSPIYKSDKYMCRSAGIPTGDGRGFPDLDSTNYNFGIKLMTARKIIDESVDEMVSIICQKIYSGIKIDYICYSAEINSDGNVTLGSSIYTPSAKVKEYIVLKINQIPQRIKEIFQPVQKSRERSIIQTGDVATSFKDIVQDQTFNEIKLRKSDVIREINALRDAIDSEKETEAALIESLENSREIIRRLQNELDGLDVEYASFFTKKDSRPAQISDIVTSIAEPNKPEIVGLVYDGLGKVGDFSWMIQQPEFSNSLFIFYDNDEQHSTAVAGKGTSVIRPYNKYGRYVRKPKSAGIPTGPRNGVAYETFTRSNSERVNEAVEEIKELILLHRYKTVYYSAEILNGNIGSGILQDKLDKRAVKYITKKIRDLENF